MTTLTPPLEHDLRLARARPAARQRARPAEVPEPAAPVAHAGSHEHVSSGLAIGPSLLCADDATRRRMLDMERHLRPARVALFAVLAGTLLALGPWIGWWPIAPLAAAAAGFQLADRMVSRSSRPEYYVMAAWAFAQLMIGVSIVFSGGPNSLFVPWLAIPAATLGARFNNRGLIAGVIWTAAIMVAATVGVNAGPIAAEPQRLVVPLTVLAGVTLLTTALMKSDIKYRAQAVLDPLTGLFNRQALALRAAELLEQSRVTETPIAVLIGDLDHFKDVNDHHGHLVGDSVLREIAGTLRTTLRTFDYIYRYGGEEFVILLPGNDEADATVAAERLRIAVAASHPAGLEMTMSFGVGISELRETELDELLIAADRALYRAKGEGRNRVCVGHALETIQLDSPDASPAARAADRSDGEGQGAASPARAFAAARNMFLTGQRVDMQELAGELGVSRATLQSWCGKREQLLGEVLASLADDIWRQADADHRDATGVERILAIYRQFVGSLVHAHALQVFLQEETHTALQVLTSSSGYVQPLCVRRVHDLLSEEQEAGNFTPQCRPAQPRLRDRAPHRGFPLQRRRARHRASDRARRARPRPAARLSSRPPTGSRRRRCGRRPCVRSAWERPGADSCRRTALCPSRDR